MLLAIRIVATTPKLTAPMKGQIEAFAALAGPNTIGGTYFASAFPVLRARSMTASAKIFFILLSLVVPAKACMCGLHTVL